MGNGWVTVGWMLGNGRVRVGWMLGKGWVGVLKSADLRTSIEVLSNHHSFFQSVSNKFVWSNHTKHVAWTIT